MVTAEKASLELRGGKGPGGLASRRKPKVAKCPGPPRERLHRHRSTEDQAYPLGYNQENTSKPRKILRGLEVSQ